MLWAHLWFEPVGRSLAWSKARWPRQSRSYRMEPLWKARRNHGFSIRAWRRRVVGTHIIPLRLFFPTGTTAVKELWQAAAVG